MNETYCNDEANADKTVRSLIAKLMSDVLKSSSVPGQQARFALAGGLYKRSTSGSFLKCSVNSIDIDQLAVIAKKDQKKDSGDTKDVDGTNDSAQKEDMSINFHNICEQYRRRTQTNLNIYTFCSKHWSKNKTYVPMFFGYKTQASWPPDETFSKWSLALFKPWIKSIEETKSGFDSYSEALCEFMYDDLFPNLKRAEILRVKRRETGVDLSHNTLGAGNDNFSPTKDRTVNANEDALAANCSASDECGYDKTEYEDVDVSKFKNLNDRLENWPNHDWRCGVHNGVKQEFSDDASQALAAYCDKYYDECNGIHSIHSHQKGNHKRGGAAGGQRPPPL